MKDGDNDSRNSSISENDGHSCGIRNRPSLFRVLDCALSTPAISGLSVELARVSHQIHGDIGSSKDVNIQDKEQVMETEQPAATSNVMNATEPATTELEQSLSLDSSGPSTPLNSNTLEKPQSSLSMFVNMFRESQLFIRQGFASGWGVAVNSFRERREQDKTSIPNPQKKVKVYMSGAQQPKHQPKHKKRFMSFMRTKGKESLDQEVTPRPMPDNNVGAAGTEEEELKGVDEGVNPMAFGDKGE